MANGKKQYDHPRDDKRSISYERNAMKLSTSAVWQHGSKRRVVNITRSQPGAFYVCSGRAGGNE